MHKRSHSKGPLMLLVSFRAPSKGGLWGLPFEEEEKPAPLFGLLGLLFHILANALAVAFTIFCSHQVRRTAGILHFM